MHSRRWKETDAERVNAECGGCAVLRSLCALYFTRRNYTTADAVFTIEWVELVENRPEIPGNLQGRSKKFRSLVGWTSVFTGLKFHSTSKKFKYHFEAWKLPQYDKIFSLDGASTAQKKRITWLIFSIAETFLKRDRRIYHALVFAIFFRTKVHAYKQFRAYR